MLYFFRRFKFGPQTTVNLTRRGLSASRRVGRLSVSSRGRASFRIAPGLTFRFKIF